MDIGRPSSVRVEPQAIWSGGAHRWYSASGKPKSHLPMSTCSMGTSMTWLKADCERTRSLRMLSVMRTPGRKSGWRRKCLPALAAARGTDAGIQCLKPLFRLDFDLAWQALQLQSVRRRHRLSRRSLTGQQQDLADAL